MFFNSLHTTTSLMKSVIQFKGYNTQSVIDDGEMRDMYNLTSDKYPVLSQRAPREKISTTAQMPIDICVKNGVSYIIDRPLISGEYHTMLKYKKAGTVITKQLSNVIPKQMVAHNNKLVIFPDKVYLDIDSDQIKSLGTSVTSAAAINPDGLTLTSGSFSEFNVGDAVTISGCTKQTGNNTIIVIKSISGSTITSYEGSFRMPNDDVTISSYTEDSITITREIPDLDYVVESNNRLWGCCSANNTIYSSKLGDPLNWFYYQSLADDSYALEVGTDGEFTGIVAYPSHLMFFKENCVHKLYGNIPSAYQITTTECFGIKRGSSKSAVVINGILYYHSIIGVMGYDGGTYPVLLSECFGESVYMDAVAGSNGKKYYISVTGSEGNVLFVYDTNRKVWHKEDDTRAEAFANLNNELIFIASGSIYTTTTIKPEDDIRWYAVFGPYDEFSEQNKTYKKLSLRIDMKEGSQLIISTKNTGEDDWTKVYEVDTERDKVITIPIMPRRQAKFSIKIEGTGRCDIESLTMTYRQGSDLK